MHIIKSLAMLRKLNNAMFIKYVIVGIYLLWLKSLILLDLLRIILVKGGYVMKRLTVLFLIFLCLTFAVIGLKPAFAVAITNTFTEGIYTLSNFNPSKSSIYSVSNISSTDNMSIIITDEDHNIVQAIRLKPNSEKHNTIPILPNYKIVLLGKGVVYFNPLELTQ